MAQAQRKAKQNAQKKNPRIVFIVVGLVIALAAILAATRGSDSSSTTSGGTDNTSATADAAQYKPVVIEGSPLERRGDSQVDPSQDAVAPVLKGQSFSGAEMTIRPGASGKPTMLVFLAHWCPHCNREIPRLIDWKEQGLVPADLRVVGITTASRSDQANWPPSQWITDMEWPWEVMADSETADAANAYGVDGYPMIVVIGADGKVKLRFSGEREVSELTTLINGALA